MYYLCSSFDQISQSDSKHLIISFIFQEKWGGYLPPGLPETVDASYESFDYFGTNSVLRRYKDATRYGYRYGFRGYNTFLPKLFNYKYIFYNYSNKGSQQFSQDVWRWLFTLLIGPMTACVAIFIELTIETMTDFKYRT